MLSLNAHCGQPERAKSWAHDVVLAETKAKLLNISLGSHSANIIDLVHNDITTLNNANTLSRCGEKTLLTAQSWFVN